MKVIIIGNALATLFTATAVTEAIANSKTTICFVVDAENCDGGERDIFSGFLPNNDIDLFYYGNVNQTFILQWSMYMPTQIDLTTTTFNPSAPTRGTPQSFLTNY